MTKLARGFRVGILLLLFLYIAGCDSGLSDSEFLETTTEFSEVLPLTTLRAAQFDPGNDDALVSPWHEVATIDPGTANVDDHDVLLVNATGGVPEHQVIDDFLAAEKTVAFLNVSAEDKDSLQSRVGIVSSTDSEVLTVRRTSTKNGHPVYRVYEGPADPAELSIHLQDSHVSPVRAQATELHVPAAFPYARLILTKFGKSHSLTTTRGGTRDLGREQRTSLKATVTIDAFEFKDQPQAFGKTYAVISLDAFASPVSEFPYDSLLSLEQGDGRFVQFKRGDVGWFQTGVNFRFDTRKGDAAVLLESLPKSSKLGPLLGEITRDLRTFTLERPETIYPYYEAHDFTFSRETSATDLTGWEYKSKLESINDASFDYKTGSAYGIPTESISIQERPSEQLPLPTDLARHGIHINHLLSLTANGGAYWDLKDVVVSVGVNQLLANAYTYHNSQNVDLLNLASSFEFKFNTGITRRSLENN